MVTYSGSSEIQQANLPSKSKIGYKDTYDTLWAHGRYNNVYK